MAKYSLPITKPISPWWASRPIFLQNRQDDDIVPAAGRYNATVRDNIRFGDLAVTPSDDAVRNAAVNAGADVLIERLLERYNNLLGYWFEKGAELTVGEWRVALARAFSAMDPWPEVDWLRRLRKLVKGRTAILITHRFTTAMLADEIHVMEDGRIVESGPHLELIAREGPYSQW